MVVEAPALGGELLGHIDVPGLLPCHLPRTPEQFEHLPVLLQGRVPVDGNVCVVVCMNHVEILPSKIGGQCHLKLLPGPPEVDAVLSGAAHLPLAGAFLLPVPGAGHRVTHSGHQPPSGDGLDPFTHR